MAFIGVSFKFGRPVVKGASKKFQKMFEKEWNKLAKEVYKNAVNHGFWKDEVNDGERMALIHAEISEGLVALKKNLLMQLFVSWIMHSVKI